MPNLLILNILTFLLTSYSRTTTPDVQLRLEYDGFTGYGEASMPPYLGQSVESVCNFLSRVDLSAFRDPFCIEDILEYVDSLSPGDTAAKAAIDIALHDLVGEVKEFIDILALNKMNVFHWHLTEDQGWRIAIDKYPLLTEIGSVRHHTDEARYNDWRDASRDSLQYGPYFYTKEQIRDIVAYAAARHISYY